MADIQFVISAIDNFSSTFDNLERQTQEAFDVANSVGSALTQVGLGVAAASGAFVGFGLNYLSQMENAEIGLKTLTGSAEVTKDVIAELQQFAVNTPFDFPGILQGTRRLIGMGMAADEAVSMMKATADAVAAAGGNAEALDGVILALGQIQARGKVSAEEMNQLAERGIPAWKILSETMGLPVSQLMKMSEEGKLLAEDALPALQKGFQQSFGGASADMAQTFSGRLDNLIEQIQILGSAIAEPLFEPLSEAMAWTIEKVQEFSAWLDSLPSGMRKFISVAILLTPVFIVLSGLFLMFIGFLPSLMGGLAAIATAFGTTTGVMLTTVGVIFGVIAAIAAIGIALYLAYTKVEWFRNAVNTAWNYIQTAALTAFNALKSAVIAVVNFMGAQWDVHRNKIINIWNSISTMFMTAVNTIISIGQGLWADLLAIWDAHGQQIVSSMTTVWNAVKTIVTTVFNVLKTIVSAGISVIVNVISIAMPFISTIWSATWFIIKNIVMSVWEAIKNIIVGAINVINGIINFFKALLTGNFSGMWEAIKQIFLGAIQAIWGYINLLFVGRLLRAGATLFKSFAAIVQAGWALIRSIFTAALNFIRSIAQNIWNVIVKIFSTAMKLITSAVRNGMNLAHKIVRSVNKVIQNVVTATWNAIQNVVISVLNGIRSLMTTVWNIIKSTVTTVVRSIWNTIKSTFNAIRSIVSSVLNGIWNLVKSIFRGIWNAVKSSMQNVVSTIRNGWNQAKSFLSSINLVSIGRNIIAGLVNGIGSMIGRVRDKIKEIGSSIVNGISDFLGINSPSRVMMQIGEWTGEGMAIGLGNMVKSVSKSAELLGQAAIPNMQEIRQPQMSTVRSYRGGNLYSATDYDRNIIPASSTAQSAEYYFEIPVVIDGREVGRATARFTDEELQRMKLNKTRASGKVGTVR